MKTLNLKNALAAFAAVFDGVSGAAVTAGLHVDIELAYAAAVEAVTAAGERDRILTIEDASDLACLRNLIVAYQALPKEWLLAFLAAKSAAESRVASCPAAATERKVAEGRVRAALVAVDGIPTEALAKSNLAVLIPHLAVHLPEGAPGSLEAYLRKEVDSLAPVGCSPLIPDLFRSLRLNSKSVLLRSVPAVDVSPQNDVTERRQFDQAERLTA